MTTRITEVFAEFEDQALIELKRDGNTLCRFGIGAGGTVSWPCYHGVSKDMVDPPDHPIEVVVTPKTARGRVYFAKERTNWHGWTEHVHSFPQ